jgi:hypothetical protein
MSPYLKPFVVARINPIRFSKATEFGVDEVMDKMTSAAGRFASGRKMWPGRRGAWRGGVTLDRVWGNGGPLRCGRGDGQDKSQYV